MGSGYTKSEVIRNIRKTKSYNELHDLAYAPKGQLYGYAQLEAKRELKRRLTGKPVRRINPSGNIFGRRFRF